jgi:hypothetical protein
MSKHDRIVLADALAELCSQAAITVSDWLFAAFD